MRLLETRSTDVTVLKNKTQRVYVYSLIVFILFLASLCLSTILVSNPLISTELIKSTITLCIGGVVLAIPFYRMQNKIEKASYKEREMTNVALNAFCLLLSTLCIFSIHSIINLILLF